MQTLHREDIKAGIRKKFGTLIAFETAKGLPRGAAKGVLIGKPSARTVEAMAEVLELPIEVIKASIQGEAGTAENDYKSTKVDLHRLNEAS